MKLYVDAAFDIESKTGGAGAVLKDDWGYFVAASN